MKCFKTACEYYFVNRLKSARHLRQLFIHLKRGGLIAYPTESSYGLGVSPVHARGLRRLIALKKRPQHKGLIVIGANLQQVSSLLQPLSATTRLQLSQIWPAPKTYILPAAKDVLPALRGQGRKQLAVRVPDHEAARQICVYAKMPLVSTSCNRAGKRPCRTGREVARQFGRQVWVLHGQTGGRKRASEIIDWESGCRLR